MVVPNRMTDQPTLPQGREGGDLLSSWKEIALHLGRSVRAVQNWEKEEGLPVHRHRHLDGASVYAYRSELDAWVKARSERNGERVEAPALPDRSAPAGSPRRVRVRILAAAAIVAAVAAIAVPLWMRAARSEIRSLAVMPLRPLGATVEVEHLGVGIADAIVYQLSESQAIEVIPTSISQAAARAGDARAIAEALGVDAVLEGTIQRSGDRVRVRIQLVDAGENRSIFSGKFDEDATDLFAVEDLVAGAVARALSLELDPAGLASKRRSSAPGAYEAYLKGRFHWAKRTPEGLKESIEDYEDALARDPSYAAAWAALGESLNLLSMHRILTPRESFPRAKEAASRALAIDSTLADAHVALGTAAFYYDWDWAGAERHLRRAIELEPRHASARHILANLLVAMGRHDEALRTMNAAIANDPTSITLVSVSAFQLYEARRWDEAHRRVRSVLDRDSSYAQGYALLGTLLIARGDPGGAIAAFERLQELIGEDSYATAYLACAYAVDPARRDDALAMKPRLLDLLDRRKLSPYDLVRFHALLGETGEAMRRLEETMARRDSGMVWLAVEPQLDSLRGEPRFQEMLREMKLAPPEPAVASPVPVA